MKKLILVDALLLGGCDKVQQNLAPEKPDFKPVTLGIGQRLQMPGTLVLVGPVTIDGDGEGLSAPLYVADAPPMILKDRPAITCLAFDEQGRLAGSRSASVPMKFGGGDLVIRTNRNIGKGKVECRLVHIRPSDL